MEEWRDIKGYEGFYQISNLGKVQSLRRGMFVKQRHYPEPKWREAGGRLLKPGVGAKGYACVVLCRNGKPVNHRVHRLVAQHFVSNPENKPAINHIDNDPLNNSAANLEWCTIKENNQHTSRSGRKAAKYKLNIS